jgi:beta-lactam-binding protein with PASTA domain
VRIPYIKAEITLPGAARRGLFYLSAVLAALVCAALVVNFIVMPIIVRQGDLVPTPALVGRPVVEARRVAGEAGLQVRVETQRPDPEYAEGDVTQQTPGPGVDIKRGRTIAIVVSTGLDIKTVPRLAGLTARQAQLDAEAAGFAVGDISEIHTDRVSRGRVIGSAPGPGASLPAGSPVSIIVSLGPPPLEIVMPSLVGKTPEEARLITEQLGLVVRSVKYETGRSRFLRDVVVLQEPVAGSRVVEGEAVTLRVGKG